jgi:hypothetical protein
MLVLAITLTLAGVAVYYGMKQEGAEIQDRIEQGRLDHERNRFWYR